MCVSALHPANDICKQTYWSFHRWCGLMILFPLHGIVLVTCPPDSKDTCDVSILCSATINSRDKWVMNLNKSSCPVCHFIISVIFVSLGLNRRTIESALPGHALLRTVQRMCPAVQHIHVMWVFDVQAQ